MPFRLMLLLSPAARFHTARRERYVDLRHIIF